MAILNKQPIKKTGKKRKEQIVAELVEKFDSSNGLVFADYQGLTNKQLEGLKKELKNLNASIVIAKNTLIKLALEKSKEYKTAKDNEGLENPTATVFIRGDMVEPLKKIQKAIKDFGKPKIKFGILEGNVVDEAWVLKIASLPARDVLLSQFVGTLNSPIRGLALTLNATIQKFVMTLDAIARLPRPASPLAEQSEAAGEPSDGGQAKSRPSAPALQGETLQAQIPVTTEVAKESAETQNQTSVPQEIQTEPDASDQETEAASAEPTPHKEQSGGVTNDQPIKQTKSEAQPASPELQRGENPNSETNPNDQNTNE